MSGERHLEKLYSECNTSQKALSDSAVERATRQGCEPWTTFVLHCTISASQWMDKKTDESIQIENEEVKIVSQDT